MFAISTALLPSPLFERVRVRAEASIMLTMVALFASIALTPWDTTEQRVRYEQPAAPQWAELLKPPTIEIGSRALAAFAVTRRVQHQTNRRHARLWQPIERARLF